MKHKQTYNTQNKGYEIAMSDFIISDLLNWKRIWQSDPANAQNHIYLTNKLDGLHVEGCYTKYATALIDIHKQGFIICLQLEQILIPTLPLLLADKTSLIAVLCGLGFEWLGTVLLLVQEQRSGTMELEQWSYLEFLIWYFDEEHKCNKCDWAQLQMQ